MGDCGHKAGSKRTREMDSSLAFRIWSISSMAASEDTLSFCTCRAIAAAVQRSTLTATGARLTVLGALRFVACQQELQLGNTLLV